MNMLLKSIIGAMSLFYAQGVIAQADLNPNWSIWEPGGYWVPILLILGVVGLVAWVIMQKKKSSQL